MSRCSANAPLGLSPREIERADRLVARMSGGNARARRKARNALNEWAARSPAHAAHYHRTLQIFATLDAAQQTLRQRYPMREMPSQNWSSNLFSAALVSALFLLVGVGIWITNPILEQRQLTTVKGERRELTLADGSTIMLNTDSQIISQIRLRSRQVKLVKGQAYFDVVHSKWKPFQVNIGQSKVTVLGTAFDIRRDDQDCAVTVVRGRVSVTTTNNPSGMELSAGERMEIHANHLQPPRHFDAPTALLWQSGKLRLTGLTLGQAAAELQRYQNGSIHVATNVAQIPLSGIVSVDSPGHVLDMLAAAFPLEIRHENDGSVEVKARQQSIHFNKHSTKPTMNESDAPPTLR